MVLLPTMRMSATVSFVAESDGPDVSRSSCFLPNIDLGNDGIPPAPIPCASDKAGRLASVPTSIARAIEMRRLKARWDKCEFRIDWDDSPRDDATPRSPSRLLDKVSPWRSQQVRAG